MFHNAWLLYDEPDAGRCRYGGGWRPSGLLGIAQDDQTCYIYMGMIIRQAKDGTERDLCRYQWPRGAAWG